MTDSTLQDDKSDVSFTTRMPKSLRDELGRAAYSSDRSLAWCVKHAISEWLEHHGFRKRDKPGRIKVV